MTERLRVEIDGDAADLQRAARQAVAALQSVGGAARTGARDAAPLTAMWGQQKRTLAELTHQASLYARVMGGVFAVGAAKATKDGLEFNATMESNQLALSSLTGSTKTASDILADLFKTAKQTPFEFVDIVDAEKKFLAFGMSVDQSKDALMAIGDAVAALGGGAEKIDRITIALGQIQAKGRIQGDELLQLAEAGIPAYQILAEKLHLSADEVKRIGDLGIDAKTGIDALVAGINDRFGGMATSQATTFHGLMSTLHDDYRQMAGSMTDDLFNELKKWAPQVDATMTRITHIWNRDDLTLEQKFRRARKVIDQYLGPLFDDVRRAIEQAHLDEQLINAVNAALPKLVDMLARGGVQAAKAFGHAFVEADPLGKIILAGWLAKTTGLVAAWQTLGRRSGRTFATSMEAEAAAGVGAAAAGGSLRGALVAAGRSLGIAAGAAFAFEFLDSAFNQGKVLSDGSRSKDLQDIINDQVGSLADKIAAETFQTGFDNPNEGGVTNADYAPKPSKRRKAKKITFPDFDLPAASTGGGGAGPSDGQLSPYGDPAVIRTIIREGRRRNVPLKVILAAIETGIVESNLSEVHHGDADSLNWRQERAQGYGGKWALSGGAYNTTASVNRFLDEAMGMGPDKYSSAGMLAADVQRPAFQYRGRYDEEASKAQEILSLFLGGSADAGLGNIGRRLYPQAGAENKASKQAAQQHARQLGAAKNTASQASQHAAALAKAQQQALEQLAADSDLAFAQALVDGDLGRQKQLLEDHKKQLLAAIAKLKDKLAKAKKPGKQLELTEQLTELLGEIPDIDAQLAEFTGGGSGMASNGKDWQGWQAMQALAQLTPGVEGAGEDRDVLNNLQSIATQELEKAKTAGDNAGIIEWAGHLGTINDQLDRLNETGQDQASLLQQQLDVARQTADMQKQRTDDLTRALALQTGQLGALAGFAGLLGGRLVGTFAQGTVRVPQTGLAWVHRDEMITPDPEGPYGTQLVNGGGPMSIELVFQDRAGELVRLVDARIAGQSARVTSQQQGRQTRLLIAAPGG